MGNRILRQITYEKLNEIYIFIRNSLYDFEEINVSKKDIKILMPNWFKFMLQNNHRRTLSFLPPEHQLHEMKFFDIEVYPHFKDEIVVYCTEFHFNKELYQHKIFEIWTLEPQK